MESNQERKQVVAQIVMPRDSIVDSVVEKFQKRSVLGFSKYGTTLDRTDLNVLDWVNHAQEELMDAVLYLEKLRKVLNESSTSATVTNSKVPTNVVVSSGSSCPPSTSSPASDSYSYFTG